MDLLKKARWFSIASMLAVASGGAVGCAAETDPTVANSDDGSSTDDITQVDQAAVKRQSIGNCWIYATSGWLEALNKDYGSSIIVSGETRNRAGPGNFPFALLDEVMVRGRTGSTRIYRVGND